MYLRRCNCDIVGLWIHERETHDVHGWGHWNQTVTMALALALALAPLPEYRLHWIVGQTYATPSQ